MQTTPIEIILRIQNPKIPREESDSRKKRSASNILRVYRREIKSHEQHLHGGLRSIMAKDPIISIPYEPGWILEGLAFSIRDVDPAAYERIGHGEGQR